MTKSYSEIFQKVKHQSYRPNRNELDEIRGYLRSDEAVSDPQAHSAIYVLSLSVPRNESDVAIVERFLQKDADDYARQAAMLSIITVWSVHSSKYISFIESYLKYSFSKDAPDTFLAAVQSYLHAKNAFGVNDLDRTFLETFRAAYHSANESDENLETFINIARSVASEKARRQGFPRNFINSFENAASVFHQLEGVLN